MKTHTHTRRDEKNALKSYILYNKQTHIQLHGNMHAAQHSAHTKKKVEYDIAVDTATEIG